MGPKSCMLICWLLAAFFCSQFNTQAEDQEYVQSEDESYDQEKPLTAADQYLNFLASGGKTTDDLVPEEDGQDEGGPGGLGHGPGQDSDYDYGTETLNLLLKHYRDQFGKLSVDKTKTKLMEDIKEMDTDDDGSVSKLELVAWLIKTAEKGSELEAQVLGGVQSYDLNKDNKLSWEEVLEDLKKLGNPENPSFKRGLVMEKVRFDHADKSKDGFLDESEYGYYATPEYFSHMDNYTIASYIHDFDHDDDLKVSKAEYLKAFDAKNDPEGHKIEEEKFQSLDKNKDGFLTADEVADIALDFTLTKFVDEHANMLFTNIDADKDNKLTTVEIIANYSLFTKGMPEEDPGTTDYPHDEL